jgi:hypothetical protein
MLAQALRLYRISFLRCLPLALLGALLSARAAAYANAQARAFAGQLTDLMNTVVTAPESAPAELSRAAGTLQTLWHSPAIWASYVGALLIGLIFHGALIARQAPLADDAHQDERDSSRRWLSRTLHCLPSLLLVVGLFALAAACAALLLAASAAMGIALVVGLLLLIAATWLWGRLQLWLVAMFTQNLSAVGALRASWNLVSGHWWRVSTLISVPYIAVSLVSSLAEALAAASSRVSGTGTASLLGQAVILTSGVVTLPVLPAAWLAIYRDLSARRGVTSGNPAGRAGVGRLRA